MAKANIQTIKLKYPLDYNEGNDRFLVDTVELRRVKTKDLRELDKKTGDINRAAFLISRLSGLDPVIVDELDGEDFNALSRAVNALMGESQKTGEGS